MPRRSPETLADYLVVAISPALIMLLVGSLVFFLVEVFYQGEFRWRLMWVMAMFVMAIVCIARIAMEEGSSYATLYALPLGGAVALAIVKFVPGGLVVGLPLMALIWWAAHKLTWDCTLVDDSQDASGQGLLQEIGFEAGDPNASASNAGVTTSGRAESATSPDDDKPWWMRWIEPDRRPHAPGVWVVYFSLAALPIFGIGGWFVPGSDGELRWRVFRLMAIYVASGLSLLVATSFLGLRRYLRQRRLEMPLDMTATWVVLGGVLIVGTLIVAAILPRPRAEHSLASVPSRVTSAVRNASRFAVGPEGTQDAAEDRQVATTEAQEGQEAKRPGDSRQGEGPKGSDRGKGKSEEQGSGKAEGKGNEKGGGKSNGKSQGKSGDGDRGQQEGQAGKSESGKSEGGKQGDAKGKAKAGEQGDAKTGHTRSEDEQEGARQGDKAKSGREPPDPNRGQQGDQQRPQDSPNQPSQDDREGQPRSDPRSGSPPPSQPQSSPTQALSNLANSLSHSLGTLLRWIFYAALLIVGSVLAWIYREQLIAAWKKLLEELRQLWSGWFGERATDGEAETSTSAPPPRPFSAFSDPFLTGAAARMSWPELVRYTFEAVEAWAREHGTPRHRDQTPHEFAQALATAQPQVARHVRSLAGWYGQLAYAPRAAASHSAEPLRELWHELASSRPVVVIVGEDE
jgi:hypothetical protein